MWTTCIKGCGGVARRNHKVTFLAGEKEAYYELKCSECGATRKLFKHEYKELKKQEEEAFQDYSN